MKNSAAPRKGGFDTQAIDGQAKGGESKRLMMTTANKITILRILLVPFFIIQVLYYVENGNEFYRFLAVISFGLAAISDSLDGYIARRYNQRSELGAMLDPLADKLLLVAGVALLSFDNKPYLDRLPLWLAVTVFSRDVILALGTAIIYYACGKITVRPHLIGKIATVLQMTCIFWTLLKWGANGMFAWALGATVCTGVSGLIYVRDGIRQLSASPSSAPAPKQQPDQAFRR
jgi:CDP-diacylglycerol--glycerol-3-phosphate 3-phosphatidyltransferase